MATAPQVFTFTHRSRRISGAYDDQVFLYAAALEAQMGVRLSEHMEGDGPLPYGSGARGAWTSKASDLYRLAVDSNNKCALAYSNVNATEMHLTMVIGA
jgi:hypothetical protein